MVVQTNADGPGREGGAGPSVGGPVGLLGSELAREFYANVSLLSSLSGDSKPRAQASRPLLGQSGGRVCQPLAKLGRVNFEVNGAVFQPIACPLVIRIACGCRSEGATRFRQLGDGGIPALSCPHGNAGGVEAVDVVH